MIDLPSALASSAAIGRSTWRNELDQHACTLQSVDSQDADFVAGFVARSRELDALLRRLRAIGQDSPADHQIVLGARGMGKTSLLRRLAIAIRDDELLAARFVPLGFREEQYNVLRPGDFWRNCGEALAQWAEANNRADLAARLDTDICGPKWKEDEAAAEQFETEMLLLGRRAVLFVDNLDIVIDAMSEEERWNLRRRFQARSGPVIIGAATRPLADATDRKKPFYEFFYRTRWNPCLYQKLRFVCAQRQTGVAKLELACWPYWRASLSGCAPYMLSAGGIPEVFIYLPAFGERRNE